MLFPYIFVEYALSTVELDKAQNSFLHQIIIHDKI